MSSENKGYFVAFVLHFCVFNQAGLVSKEINLNITYLRL